MKAKLAVDVIALIVYMVVSLPSLTTIGVHEWLGLGIFAVFIVHIAQHISWLGNSLKRGARFTWARQGRLILDVLIAISLTVCIVSGLMVSGAVLPALGFYAEGYYFWDPLHSISAKILLALIVVHIAADVIIAWRIWKGSAKSESFTEAIVEDE